MTTERPPAPTTLTFRTDRGASRSLLIALGLLAAIIAWMASGIFLPKAEPPAPEAAVIEAPLVKVRSSHAEPVVLTFRAEGQALPDRDSIVTAEVAGTLVELATQKGAELERGGVIARILADEAEASLQEAREELARAQREFDNASALRERGVATADRVSEARASLAAAQARVTEAEKTLEDLVITAPFAGRIEALPLNEGEHVALGAEVARIVDNDPLTVAIQVPQQSLNRLRVGQKAEVRFITGQTREGEVTFVGTAADSSTRTFLSEIEIANPGGEIPAGISAEISIPTGEETAHFIEPSIISLNPDGELGVKIEEDGVVRFIPVEVANADLAGIWATGLPDEARIITIGQGFVRDGEAVRAQDEDAPETGTDAKATEAANPETANADTSALTRTEGAGR